MAGGAAWLKDFPGKRGENALVEVVLMGSVSPSGGGQAVIQCSVHLEQKGSPSTAAV